MPDNELKSAGVGGQVITLLKLALVAGCIAIVVNRLNFYELLRVWQGLVPGFLLLAAFFIMTEPLVVAFKWHLLIRGSGVPASFGEVLRAILTGNFLSILFPTSLSADALRLALLGRRHRDLAHLTGTLVADRLAAVAGLVVLSLAGLPFALRSLGWSRALMGVVLLCVFTSAAIAVILAPWTQRLLVWLDGWAQQHPSAGRTIKFMRRATGIVRRVYNPLMQLIRQPRLLLIVFSMGIGVQLWRIMQIRMLFLSLGATHAFIYDVAFVPMIILLTLLPISFFGLGIKEGAFIFFFTSIGLAVEKCVGVSLLTYPLIILALLPGGVLFLLGDRTQLMKSVEQSETQDVLQRE